MHVCEVLVSLITHKIKGVQGRVYNIPQPPNKIVKLMNVEVFRNSVPAKNLITLHFQAELSNCQQKLNS